MTFHTNCHLWTFDDNLHEMSKPIFCKNKKNIINLSSAELPHYVVMDKEQQMTI